MNKNKLKALLIALAIVAVSAAAFLTGTNASAKAAAPSKLGVLWTSGDPDVAHKVCFMYTNAAKTAGWFDEVLLIVWGPSSRLLATDKDIQAKVKKMQTDGITVQACQACADSYGISDKLRSLGIEVKYMGKPLSDMLKSDWKMLTF